MVDALAWGAKRMMRLASRERDPVIRAMYEERWARQEQAYNWYLTQWIWRTDGQQTHTTTES